MDSLRRLDRQAPMIIGVLILVVILTAVLSLSGIERRNMLAAAAVQAIPLGATEDSVRLLLGEPQTTGTRLERFQEESGANKLPDYHLAPGAEAWFYDLRDGGTGGIAFFEGQVEAVKVSDRFGHTRFQRGQ